MYVVPKIHDFRTRVGHGFLRGLLSSLDTLNTIHAEFNPPRYPRNAQFLDQQRIDADMYRALKQYGEKARRDKTAAA